MAYSKAQNKATQKYVKYNYDEIKIRVPKGKRALYQHLAKEKGCSLNSYIVSLLEENATLSDTDLSPQSCVKQVLATMAIEDMYFSSEFVSKMLKVASGELSSDEVRQEVIRKYARQ